MRSTTESSGAVAALYAALADRDVLGLSYCLGDGFVGHVSAGMPCGVGGVHVGREAMLRDVWLRVFHDYDVRPVPEDVSWTADGRAVVHGHYLGTRRDDGAVVAAEFVHLLTLDVEGRVGELRQITDTAAWAGAVATGTMA